MTSVNNTKKQNKNKNKTNNKNKNLFAFKLAHIPSVNNNTKKQNKNKNKTNNKKQKWTEKLDQCGKCLLYNVW